MHVERVHRKAGKGGGPRQTFDKAGLRRTRDASRRKKRVLEVQEGFWRLEAPAVLGAAGAIQEDVRGQGICINYMSPKQGAHSRASFYGLLASALQGTDLYGWEDLGSRPSPRSSGQCTVDVCMGHASPTLAVSMPCCFSKSFYSTSSCLSQCGRALKKGIIVSEVEHHRSWQRCRVQQGQCPEHGFVLNECLVLSSLSFML